MSGGVSASLCCGRDVWGEGVPGTCESRDLGESKRRQHRLSSICWQGGNCDISK